MKILNILLFLFIASVSSGSAQQLGSAAPDFTLQSLSNEEITLSQFRGRVVYLFFFGYA